MIAEMVSKETQHFCIHHGTSHCPCGAPTYDAGRVLNFEYIDLSGISEDGMAVAKTLCKYVAKEVSPGVFVPCQFFSKICPLEDGKLPAKYAKATVRVFDKLARDGLIDSVLCAPAWIRLASGKYDAVSGEFTRDDSFNPTAACFFFAFPTNTFPRPGDFEDTRSKLNAVCGPSEPFGIEGSVGNTDWTGLLEE